MCNKPAQAGKDGNLFQHLLMKLILQSVSSAEVQVYADESYQECLKTEKIWIWMLIYFWVGKPDESRSDRKTAIDKFTSKLTTLKLLSSAEGKIEVPLHEVGSELLVISNFTLFGSYKNGTKIDFSQSGNYGFAKEVYDFFLTNLEEKEFKVKSWKFWADMLVSSVNNGPINYLFEI